MLSVSLVAQALPLAIESQTSVGDLVPYLIVLGAGFLVGAWGQSARSPIAITAGLLLVMVAIVGFILAFPICPDGTTCF